MKSELNLETTRPERLATEIELDDLIQAVLDLPNGWTANSAEAVDYVLAFRVATTTRRLHGATAIAELHETIEVLTHAHDNLDARYAARWSAWLDSLEVARHAAISATGESARDRVRKISHVGKIEDELKQAPEGVLEQQALLKLLPVTPGRLSQILRQMEDAEIIVREVNGREKRIRLVTPEPNPQPESASSYRAVWRQNKQAA